METTCGNCEHLLVVGNKRNPIATCKETDLVVPHGWDGEQFAFWRIPISCPKNEGVKKSDKSSAKKNWVYKKLEDIPFEEWS
jgi:hypothetical protein